MGRIPFVILVVVLPVAVRAQVLRTVAHLDGHPHESARVEGRSSYVGDPTRCIEGCGALRIGPSAKDAYYGLTLRQLAGRSPKTLRFSVFQEGPVAIRYRLKLRDSDQGKDDEHAANVERECAPGAWTEIEVDLRSLPSERGARALDFRDGIAFFRFSRRKQDGTEAPFVIDAIRYGGEAGAEDAAKAVAQALKPDRDADDAARADVLRRNLLMLPEAECVKAALLGLSRDLHEGVRYACRRALAGLSDDESLAALEAALMKQSGSTRLELLWALAAMPSKGARASALHLVGDPKTPWPERTALLQGLVRRGATDLAGAVNACPSDKPWPQRAALVFALRQSGAPESVDALIEVLDKPGSPRVQHDAVEALVEICGNDLGTDAAAWREWWRVARNQRAVDADAAPPKTTYASSFFGVPVTAGRLLFLLDISGSMRDPVKGGKAEAYIKAARHLEGAEIKSRLDLAKAELLHAVRNAPAGASVSIAQFNDAVRWLLKDYEPVNAALKTKLPERLKPVDPGRKTDIHAAMSAVFQGERATTGAEWEDGPDTVFLLSDGAPSDGAIKDLPTLRDAILRWNLGRMIKINLIAIGDERRREPELAAWCRASGGAFQDLSSEKTPPEQDGGK